MPETENVSGANPPHRNNLSMQQTCVNCVNVAVTASLEDRRQFHANAVTFAGLGDLGLAESSSLGSSQTAIPERKRLLLDPCRDELDNCTHYRKDTCCGLFEPWSRVHCALTCGFCGFAPERLCVDKTEYCNIQNSDLCTSEKFKFYREENCAGFCRLCELEPWEPALCAAHLYNDTGSTVTTPETETTSEITADTGSTVTTPETETTFEITSERQPVVDQCGDVLDNCTHYHKNYCCGLFEPWSRAHCALNCGFCGVAPQRLCVDKIDYCNVENPDLCTNEKYKFYREEYCAGFCRLCELEPWMPAPCAANLFETSASTESSAVDLTVE